MQPTKEEIKPVELYHRTNLKTIPDILSDGVLKSPKWSNREVPIYFSEEYKSPKTTWGFVSLVFGFNKIKDVVKKTIYREANPDTIEKFQWHFRGEPRTICLRLKWEKEWYSWEPVSIYLAHKIIFFRRHPMGFVILHRKSLDKFLKIYSNRLKNFEVVIDEKP